MKRADVAVVGAGLFGTSLACKLARAGMRVELYDRATPGAGDTGRSFGMVRAHYSNEVTVRLAKRGIELLAGDPRSAYVRTGYLLPVAEADRAACAANVELGRSLGVATALVEPDEIAHLEPRLRTDGIAVAAYERDGGVVDPGRMTLASFAEAVSLGVDVHLGSQVVGVESLDARTVVVAAGGWSKRLLLELPVELRRIDVLRVAPMRVSVVVSDTVTNVVVRPGVGDVAWAVAYSKPEVYADRDDAPENPRPEYPQTVRTALEERYHDAYNLAWIDGWTGAYDATPDWNPIVGFVRDGVYAIAGMSGHGLKLAPAIAECVAAELAGTEPPIDLRPLRFSRFAEGDLLRLAYGPSARA
ncbi:MAG TPA: FAD-binding oxidoreductase [Gaiellales bacterium]|nr:FAD-binding oxidoreductase [Gaiellales bacterium]